MTTVYAPRSGPGSSGTALWSILVIILVAIAALWFFGHERHRALTRDTRDTTDAVAAKVDGAVDKLTDKRTLQKADTRLKAVGSAASSALSKAGTAASSAISETSEDIKAAAARQKQQDAEHGTSSATP